MKNANTPAMPQDRGIWVEGIGDCPTLATGLTKREHFAGLALQGILVNAGRNSLDFHNAHQEAVRQADLLLAELEKSE